MDRQEAQAFCLLCGYTELTGINSRSLIMFKEITARHGPKPYQCKRLRIRIVLGTENFRIMFDAKYQPWQEYSEFEESFARMAIKLSDFWNKHGV